MLLRGREPLKILERGDEEGAKTPLLILREKIFGLLGNKEKPLFFKMREAARALRHENAGAGHDFLGGLLSDA